jgi:hypothetical protein
VVTRRSPDDGLRALFRRHLPQVHWSSIETGVTQSGVPDMEGAYRGAQFWVEMKATRAWVVEIRREQIGWHLRRAREGCPSFIAVRRRHDGGPRLGPPVDELWLWAGADVVRVRDQGLRATGPLLVEEGGPGRWRWPQVLLRLSRPERCSRGPCPT